jgi:chromosomal replication initiator protein
MYVVRELTDLSYPAIAREFGGRDHTTVIHAVEKISTQMRTQRPTYDQVTELMQTVRSDASVP